MAPKNKFYCDWFQTKKTISELFTVILLNFHYLSERMTRPSIFCAFMLQKFIFIYVHIFLGSWADEGSRVTIDWNVAGVGLWEPL